jgi:hypothetical protein
MKTNKQQTAKVRATVLFGLDVVTSRLSRPCSKCGAKKGELCHTPSGKLYPLQTSLSHSERCLVKPDKLIQKLTSLIGNRNFVAAVRSPDEGTFACWNDSRMFDLATSAEGLRRNHPRAKIAVFRGGQWQTHE